MQCDWEYLMSRFAGRTIVRKISVCAVILFSATAIAEEAVEAAASCIVTHEREGEQDEKTITCFENIALERTSFESGVCQWKSDSQAAANVRTMTQFVAYCPNNYSAFCDRLVVGPQMTAPVKIFIYDRSAEVLARAKKQCRSGGGNWSTNDRIAEDE